MEDEIDKEFKIADPNAEGEIKQPIIWNVPDDICETTEKLIQDENLIEVKNSPKKTYSEKEEEFVPKTSEEKSKIFANAQEITEEKGQNQIINFHPDKVQV